MLKLIKFKIITRYLIHILISLPFLLITLDYAWMINIETFISPSINDILSTYLLITFFVKHMIDNSLVNFIWISGRYTKYFSKIIYLLIV